MEDVQTFKDQLALVNIQLESDKDNADLLTLKGELEELISLTEQAAAAAAEPKKSKGKGKEKEKAEHAANWQDSGEYRAGMDCMAKYKDGKWYPARINQVVGSQESPLYTITFKGYTSSTNVPVSSLRPHDPSAPIPVPVKRPAELSEREKEKKKRKGEKWMSSLKERDQEARSKQNSWEKFGKKAQKKGIHIAGLEGKSVFRTSDSPYARVGVFNSGHGMKDFDKMGKHKFARPLDEE
ncbi:hypothetical protein CC85DRAFT_329843 [Cutaneotrichosporon oleaginosum]|uniref:Tudor domain-containing protein n=1 Tax=Cutaneotrichosporon oleaginosum TaxID=879819 RepID=A0A0J0XHE8_9TREE|nr:uncharacterized protein CC85DRAFT_329843 [Cutaneotrichosporon oleaginosum]KLT40432.1 hypothetical protein CC85DRAFT_329843 [Cutaneotrichosporon oleaginosum]TXT15373.1 hypothetical protein COLE_01566 [Cutaneotrichosporon oleaginosum]